MSFLREVRKKLGEYLLIGGMIGGMLHAVSLWDYSGWKDIANITKSRFSCPASVNDVRVVTLNLAVDSDMISNDAEKVFSGLEQKVSEASEVLKKEVGIELKVQARTVYQGRNPQCFFEATDYFSFIRTVPKKNCDVRLIVTNKDFSFHEDSYGLEGITFSGSGAMIVRTGYWNLANLIIHEGLHLFYVEHSSDSESIMYYMDYGSWKIDEETKVTTLDNKWRWFF